MNEDDVVQQQYRITADNSNIYQIYGFCKNFVQGKWKSSY